MIETKQVTLTTEKKGEDAQWLNVTLNTDSVTPDCLKDLKAAVPLSILDPKRGVIINGRMPMWLACFLTHECHAASFVAMNDPRLGAIVIESHNPSRQTGEIIDV